ncbi:CLN3 protein-domain-containing protein [Aspergillus lucknowensis]|uniref:CLN3 protein-domain-containing protein n=1 Tax=Aspergillus lucknowensis TaxID=176173 RepID=A0ABR4M895_9EURO
MIKPRPRLGILTPFRAPQLTRRFATEARLTPDHVRIVEVGPRDGLQNEKKSISLETKLELIGKLAKTGVTTIEAGSFVPPKWVPQMASTAEICEHLLQTPPQSQHAIAYNYLVPNVKGLESLIKVMDATGVPASTIGSETKSPTTTEVSLFAAATEAFSKANTNCTIQESLERIRPIVALAKTRDIRVRGYVSVALGCPYEGPDVSPSKVADITATLLEMGADEVSVADTTGMGTAPRTMELLRALKAAGIANTDLALHFHDTYGQALVNTIVGLEHGIRIFDSSVGGLGGCPYSKGATGNVSTEDLVHTVHGLGMHTGINLEEMSRIGAWISGELGRANESRAGKATVARLQFLPSIVMPEGPMLPLPGTPSSSWVRFRAQLAALFHGADRKVCVAFWLFGLINNLLYVIILSAALDLVGPNVPKGVVLLADVLPSFATKLVAPYFIHAVPYSMRIVICVFLSALGMLVVALSPAYVDGGTISSKLAGIVLASLSSGIGELSFVGLTHFYGPFSLAAWGSGTGAAGLAGAGSYALATSTLGLKVKTTLLASAFLPAILAVSFFFILPRSAIQSGYHGITDAERHADESVPRDLGDDESEGLLGSSIHSVRSLKSTHVQSEFGWHSLKANLQRARGLFFPFMLPLLLVYIAEYTINQGVSPTLLFPLKETPFEHFRAFYPAYNAIYQVGVFISRSSTPFFRIHDLYLPSFLQIINLAVLSLHSLFDFIPSVYLVFIVIFWEGLLGGLVYVNTFAEIGDRVPREDREFSLGATTVSDSGGICIAGFLGMAFEVNQLDHVLGRPSTKFRKVQVLAVFLFWSFYLFKGNRHGPPGVRGISSRLTQKLSAWQTTVIVILWLYLSRNFAKIVGLECPEPLANLYSRSFFRATWITTALDAGFWTAMKVRPNWLRDFASLGCTAYYLLAAEQADDKVRRVRATLTLEHMRVSWNKGTTPYLWALAALVRPRLMRYPPRAIRIPRPHQSVYHEPTNAWLYFDGPLSALRDQTCLILDIPGGGFVSMTPRHSEDRLLAWAGKTKLPILSLNYKKAPEYPYPYALNECYDVYHSIITTRGRCLGLSGDAPPRIILTGDSAGANLAVGTALMVLQSSSSGASSAQAQGSLPGPAGLVLAYPALNMKIESWMTEEQMALIQERSTSQSVRRRKDTDYQRLTPYATPGTSFDNFRQDSPIPVEDLEAETFPEEASDAVVDEDKRATPETEAAYHPNTQPKKIQTRLAVSSMISYVNDRILSPEMMRAMIILYIGPHNRPDFNTDYLLSPVLAPEALLAQFPKTYILTGERDPLVDDTVVFAGRLRQAKLRRFQERQELGLEKSHRAFNEKDHVEVSLLPGVSHGFMQMAGFFPDSWKHINRCATWIQNSADVAMAEARRPLPSGLGTRSQSSKVAADQVSLRHHKRSLTGDSSADEDKPLEMSIGKMTSLKAVRRASDPGLRDGNEAPKPSLQDHNLENGEALAPNARDRSISRGRMGRSKGLGKRRPLAPHHLNILNTMEWASDPVSPVPRRKRDHSVGSLASEEDLLSRRMSGLAGGLMGLGEGARTP